MRSPARTHERTVPFRLVKYAHFPLRKLFPLHDELCVEEGFWMHRHLAGDAEAAQQLACAGGRVARLYAGLWGCGDD